MRKRSKYRPKPIYRDPVAYVLESLTPLGKVEGQLVTIKIKNHAAMAALTQGKATKADIDILIAALNITEALYRLGFGREYKDVVGQGIRSLLQVGERGASTGKFILTGPEMNSLNLVMELHDAQLDLCTVQDMEKAIALVDLERRSGRMVRIKGQQDANNRPAKGDTSTGTQTHHPPAANTDAS